MIIKPTRLTSTELDGINAETHNMLLRFKLLDLADIKIGGADPVHQAILDTLLTIPRLLAHIAALEQPPTDEALWRRVRESEALLLDVRAALYIEYLNGHLPPVLATVLRDLQAKVQSMPEQMP